MSVQWETEILPVLEAVHASLEVYVRREDAKRFIEDVRCNEPELAKKPAYRGARAPSGRAELTRAGADLRWQRR